MNEPRRFRLERDGKTISYGVEFDGGRAILQDLEEGEPGTPHPIPSIERILFLKKLDQEAVVWIDE